MATEVVVDLGNAPQYVLLLSESPYSTTPLQRFSLKRYCGLYVMAFMNPRPQLGLGYKNNNQGCILPLIIDKIM